MSKFIEIPASKRSISLRKPVYGMGINDADYMVQPKIDGKKTICPYYISWKNMLRRCYCHKLHQVHPSYIGCTVAKEWLTFSVFKNWMSEQEWNGKHLDKDIKIIGNKVYSPYACIFVSARINTLFNSRPAARGSLLIGVYFNKTIRKFQSQCSNNGAQKNLGYFNTQEEASDAYKSFKHKVILEASNDPENSYIKQYLLNHAELLIGGDT
ncbi:MAG: hypothetical protein JKY50_00620 [Oleispira sp.]|nr:hypothetical protein [Oleispira sp.]